MKRIVISDIHHANHKDFGEVLENGRNARFQASLDVWDEVEKIGEKEEVTQIDILGDLFHVREKIDMVVYETVYRRLENLSQKFFLIILAGNHDQALKDGSITALYPFGSLKNVKVITEPTEIGNSAYIPYQEKFSLKLLRTDAPYLFLHQGIAEAEVGDSNYILGEGIAASKLAKFKRVFAGHYHKPQTINNNIIVTGSPIQLNFGERGTKRGFWLFDDTENRAWFFDTPNQKQFRQIEVSSTDDLKGFKDEDYVKFIVKSKKFRNFNFSQLAKNFQVEIDLPRDFQQRLEIKAEQSEEDILSNYVNQFSEAILAQGLHPERVKELGKELWKEYNDL